jgi:hypothetical protein
MNLEDTKLSEINWGKKNAIWSHVYVECKTIKFMETENGIVSGQGLSGLEDWTDIGQRI